MIRWLSISPSMFAQKKPVSQSFADSTFSSSSLSPWECNCKRHYSQSSLECNSAVIEIFWLEAHSNINLHISSSLKYLGFYDYRIFYFAFNVCSKKTVNQSFVDSTFSSSSSLPFSVIFRIQFCPHPWST